MTKVPISTNRVYNSFIAPNNQVYGLYLASAACVPLHGFGNFVIYLTISWTECKEFMSCAGSRSSRSGSSVVQFKEKQSTRLRVIQTLKSWWEVGRMKLTEMKRRRDGGGGGGGSVDNDGDGIENLRQDTKSGDQR